MVVRQPVPHFEKSAVNRLAAPASTGMPDNQPAVTYYHSYDLDGQALPRQRTCIVYDAWGCVTCMYAPHDALDASSARYCLPDLLEREFADDPGDEQEGPQPPE